MPGDNQRSSDLPRQRSLTVGHSEGAAGRIGSEGDEDLKPVVAAPTTEAVAPPNSSDHPSKKQAQGIGDEGFAKADDRHLSAATPGAQSGDDGLCAPTPENREPACAAFVC